MVLHRIHPMCIIIVLLRLAIIHHLKGGSGAWLFSLYTHSTPSVVLRCLIVSNSSRTSCCWAMISADVIVRSFFHYIIMCVGRDKQNRPNGFFLFLFSEARPVPLLLINFYDLFSNKNKNNKNKFQFYFYVFNFYYFKIN